MLEEIVLANEASYSSDGQSLSKLKPINFIFGTNGSGKTTISRVIAKPNANGSCKLTWRNGRALECLVYNSDFTVRNYTSKMPGIFTLGEESAEALRAIELQKAKVERLQADLDKLENTLGAEDGSTGKRLELRDLRAVFEEECWKIKVRHDQDFQEAFAGLRNSKEKFCDRVIKELDSNIAPLVAVEQLKLKAETIFQSGLERHAAFPIVESVELLALERSSILLKKVVGKDDVELAPLIRRLGNSDWVRQGLGYIIAKESQCPFCQQEITDALYRELNAYFDEMFVNDLAAVRSVSDAYAVHSERVTNTLQEITGIESRYLDVETFKLIVGRIDAQLEINKRLLERKLKEPSTPISLDTIKDLLDHVSDAITASNASIAEHNALVDNLAAEQAALKSQIWKCLLEESSGMLSTYKNSAGDLDKAISGLTVGVAAKRAELNSARQALVELERSITSVRPTVNAINATLASFGFSNFKLRTAGERGIFYEIVRHDGADAATTLSEGEKSFITFLYFYNLLHGSQLESGMTADRIVVFDDPVSSLDSDILFIVSALIKRILADACEEKGYIKQVFILTHNIYFHKEVSFDAKRADQCRAHETFWIVRKVGLISTLTGYSYNPIKTSYELLWSEVRHPQRSSMTIQNTLRRILENYFKILGNLDKDDIVAKFEGRDKQICGSLFSWVNDGSHSVHDDLYISADEQIVDRYLTVFRQIFEKTEHFAHYRMMMGINAGALEVVPPVVAPAAAAVVPA